LQKLATSYGYAHRGMNNESYKNGCLGDVDTAERTDDDRFVSGDACERGSVVPCTQASPGFRASRRTKRHGRRFIVFYAIHTRFTRYSV